MTRRHRASHEAGHACLCAHLGARFSHVYVAAGPGEPEGGAVAYLPATFNIIWGAEDEIIRKMGGEAGVRVHAGKGAGRITPRRLTASGMWFDYQESVQIIMKVVDEIDRGKAYPSSFDKWLTAETIDHDAFIQSCYRKAHAILDARREFHSRVTEALVERGRLTEKEVLLLENPKGETQ